MDPPDEGDNTRGKWRIEHGRLIETWRFSDETEDSSSVEEIIELTEKIFKSRIILQEGPVSPRVRSFRAKFSLYSCNGKEIGRIALVSRLGKALTTDAIPGSIKP